MTASEWRALTSHPRRDVFRDIVAAVDAGTITPPATPGRVYDVDPKPGERLGRRLRVEVVRGGSWGDVRYATRVEFDAAADSGPATVTAFITDADGRVVYDHTRGEAARATFRGFVRLTSLPGAA